MSFHRFRNSQTTPTQFDVSAPAGCPGRMALCYRTDRELDDLKVVGKPIGNDVCAHLTVVFLAMLAATFVGA